MKFSPVFSSSLILGVIACVFLCCCGDGEAQTTDTVTTITRAWKGRANSFFGVHFDLHPNKADTILGRDVSRSNIGRFLDRVKPDYVQYDCKGHPGYTGYPSKVGYPAPGIVQDSLAIWREATRMRRIGLFIHYSGVIDGAAIEHHPGWACVDANGHPSASVTSNFGPYTDELMIPQLKEAIAAYDLDGVWADGECWGSQLDYCTTAVQLWHKYTKFTSVPLSAKDPHWDQWKNFNRQYFIRHLDTWTKAVKEWRPQAELCSNWAYSTQMPVPITTKVDFLSGDFSPADAVDSARFESRYLESNDMPWDLLSWGFNGNAGYKGPFSKKPAIQLMQEASVVLSQGGGVSVYYVPTRGGHISDYMIKTAGKLADFCRARESFSHKSKSVPQIALLLSTSSYEHRSDNVFAPGNAYGGLTGDLHALLENHYNVDILAEHQLEPRLKEFPVIALAQAGQTPTKFRAELLRWVDNGGHLMLLDVESALAFRKDIGADMSAKAKPAETFLKGTDGYAVAEGNWTYAKATTAVVVARRWPNDTPGSKDKGGAVAATRIVRGKGDITAVYGDFGEIYAKSHHPFLREWLGNLVNDVFVDPAFTLDGPSDVDASLRTTADGRLALHLVNLSGAQRAQNFSAIDNVPWVGPLTARIKLVKQPKSVKLMPDAETLKTSFKDGVLEVVVPKVHIHEALVIDGGR